MSETRKHQLRTLPNLVAKDVQHPHDIAATAVVEDTPV